MNHHQEDTTLETSFYSVPGLVIRPHRNVPVILSLLLDFRARG